MTVGIFFVYFYTVMKYADPYEDPELIAMLMKKDPRAYDWLYEKYAGALYTFIGQVIPGEKEKNEILQEVFLTIFHSIVDYHPTKSRLFTYILNIARQASIRRIQPGTLITEFQEPNRLAKLMKKLDPEEMELLHLSWFKGYTVEQAALQMNISPAVAQKRIRNTLLQLYAL